MELSKLEYDGGLHRIFDVLCQKHSYAHAIVFRRKGRCSETPLTPPRNKEPIAPCKLVRCSESEAGRRNLALGSKVKLF